MRTCWWILGALLLTACGDDDGDDTDGARDMATASDGFVASDGFAPVDGGRVDALTPLDDAATPELTLPPANAGFDYQLGEAYAPPSGVTLVVRDRSASPAPGIYNVC